MSDTQDKWWETVHNEEREMARVLCGAWSNAAPDKMVCPSPTPELAMSPRGLVPVINPSHLVPLWTMFMWQARAALRVKDSPP